MAERGVRPSSIPYVLFERGAQIEHIAAHGLSYRRPGGHRVLRLTTADKAGPPALQPGDILVLAVKAQDVESATEFWAWRQVEGAGFASELPLVTLQNGLAAEDIALRRFDPVYAASIRIPAHYTVTGEVVVGGEPNVGIVALGRYPEGLDDTALSIITDLSKAGYLAEARPDIRRWKAAKLEHNVTNAVELFAGPSEIRSKAAASLAQEARTRLCGIAAKLTKAKAEPEKTIAIRMQVVAKLRRKARCIGWKRAVPPDDRSRLTACDQPAPKAGGSGFFNVGRDCFRRCWHRRSLDHRPRQ
ncbi:ketopantoate reductase family protein [Rhizobium leguminosarum]|uniref:ketopantoate reductase family protein n=1 Tax=Rhizobium leguminosarum TaxID=384 RepID=UPI0021B0CC69|nr:2-dehydropantoate 2-reductase [Rhizobium leguminosarum]